MKLSETQEIDLGRSLHDGILERVSFSALERSLKLVVDVPYLWSFHKLEDSTRFHLLLRQVREMTAVNHVPWPGADATPENLPYSERERLRQETYNKGHLESIAWSALAEKLQNSEDYEILSAKLHGSSDSQIHLSLVLMNNVEFDYPELRVLAEGIKFNLQPDVELPLTSFLSLGNAYWDDFARRPTPASPTTEH